MSGERQDSDLVQLIRSLKSSEKRYFKVFAGQHVTGGENTYVRIFDFIDKEPVYDQEKLVELLGEKFRKQLPVLQHYLYKLLLKSLRNYYSGKTIEFKIKELLLNAEILFAKNLINQCFRSLKKARKLAEENERQESLMDILSWYITLSLKISGGKIDALDSLIDELMNEVNEVYQQLENMLIYKSISYKMLLLNRQEQFLRSDATRRKYQALLTKPEMQDPELALSLKARLYYHQAQMIWYFAQGDHDHAYEHSAEIIRCMERIPSFIQERPENYLTALQNLVTIGLKFRPEEEIFSYIDKLGSFPEQIPRTFQSKDFSNRAALYSFNLRVNYYLTKHRFPEALAEAEETIRFIGEQQFDYNINEGFILFDLYFNLAKAYFFNEAYEKALKYINTILHSVWITQQYELFLNVKLLQIMVSFELGHERVLESSFISFYRLLYSRKKKYKLEHILLKFIRKMARAKRDEVPELLRELYERAVGLRDDPYEGKLFEHLDWFWWINKYVKLEGISETEKKQPD